MSSNRTTLHLDDVQLAVPQFVFEAVAAAAASLLSRSPPPTGPPHQAQDMVATRKVLHTLSDMRRSTGRPSNDIASTTTSTSTTTTSIATSKRPNTDMGAPAHVGDTRIRRLQSNTSASGDVTALTAVTATSTASTASTATSVDAAVEPAPNDLAQVILLSTSAFVPVSVNATHVVVARMRGWGWHARNCTFVLRSEVLRTMKNGSSSSGSSSTGGSSQGSGAWCNCHVAVDFAYSFQCLRDAAAVRCAC